MKLAYVAFLLPDPQLQVKVTTCTTSPHRPQHLVTSSPVSYKSRPHPGPSPGHASDLTPCKPAKPDYAGPSLVQARYERLGITVRLALPKLQLCYSYGSSTSGFSGVQKCLGTVQCRAHTTVPSTSALILCVNSTGWLEAGSKHSTVSAGASPCQSTTFAMCFDAAGPWTSH